MVSTLRTRFGGLERKPGEEVNEMESTCLECGGSTEDQGGVEFCSAQCFEAYNAS